MGELHCRIRILLTYEMNDLIKCALLGRFYSYNKELIGWQLGQDGTEAIMTIIWDLLCASVLFSYENSSSAATRHIGHVSAFSFERKFHDRLGYLQSI